LVSNKPVPVLVCFASRLLVAGACWSLRVSTLRDLSGR
jgi:hypothetical protein